jgi:hypothetical protein
VGFQILRTALKNDTLAEKDFAARVGSPGTDFLKIFAENFVEKIGVFDSKQS